MGVTISHPDKALWPDARRRRRRSPSSTWPTIYEAVGDWMLPHIKGRPCSIIRTPDGIDGEQLLPAPRRARAPPACSPRSRSPATASPICRSTASRPWPPWPRSARPELHPWNCQPGQPEMPGRLVFDLDPAPDVAFDGGDRGGARRSDDRLEALGLVSLLQDHRRQGPARGHAADAGQGHRLGRRPRPSPATSAARWPPTAPTAIWSTWPRTSATGQIFLDYLRNDRMATAVAPLSPRARARRHRSPCR